MIMRQKARHSRGRRSGTRCCGGTDEIRSIVVMGQGAQDLRTPDYYLTTVLKDTKKTGSHCAATASRFAPFFLNICAKLLEPLGHQRSSVDGLITPTTALYPTELKSSNPCATRFEDFQYLRDQGLRFSGRFVTVKAKTHRHT